MRTCTKLVPALIAILITITLENVATAQTVVFSETFTGPDQSNMNGNFTFDNDWGFSSSGPGPDVVSGVLGTFNGTLWDAGVLGNSYNIDPGSETVTIEFDLIVLSVGSIADFFAVQLFDDISNGGINIIFNTSASSNDVLIEAFDNSIGFDFAALGGPGSFVAGTAYHFTGVFQNGNSLDGTISIIATAGPGGDVLNSQSISLSVDAATMTPVRRMGLAGSEAILFDNLTITTSPPPAVPSTRWPGATVLMLLMIVAAGSALRLRRPACRD